MWLTDYKSGKASLMEYMGIRKQPRNASLNDKIGYYNIVPFLAYYDVFKNYYANKQEERFYVMGGSKIQNATAVVSGDFTAMINNKISEYITCLSPSTITITGTDIKLEDIETIKYTLDGSPISIYMRDDIGRYSWEIVSEERNKIVIKSMVGRGYQLTRQIQGVPGAEVTFKGTTENITQGTVTKAYTSSFPLTEIDDLREYILSKGREEILINKESDERLKSLFIYNVLFSPNPETQRTL